MWGGREGGLSPPPPPPPPPKPPPPLSMPLHIITMYNTYTLSGDCFIISLPVACPSFDVDYIYMQALIYILYSHSSVPIHSFTPNKISTHIIYTNSNKSCIYVCTSVSGARRNLYLVRIVMRASFVSMRANLIPMQLRGPQPNGMWGNGWSFFFLLFREPTEKWGKREFLYYFIVQKM